MKKLLVGGVLAILTVSLSACGTTTKPESNAACQYKSSKAAARDVDKPAGDAPTGMVGLRLTTSAGDIDLDLDADQAPCTVNSITHLAKQGYFDNTVCHRLTNSGIFVLQCGDPTGSGSGGPGFSFADEYPVGTGEKGLYKAGTIAMANAGPDTNGSQFFLNYEDSPLPPNYTLFGTMTPESLQVVRSIAAKGTATGAGDGAPAEEVTIQKAEVK
ncbi:peptidylprolyl isomerase [Corynebacterium sp. H127]|uniref:peptidylprolyl isomerase n=1 Tax=Corynebacterium sp. H127 TaxID=3133418 RepID=UPI0030AB662C